MDNGRGRGGWVTWIKEGGGVVEGHMDKLRKGGGDLGVMG